MIRVQVVRGGKKALHDQSTFLPANTELPLKWHKILVLFFFLDFWRFLILSSSRDFKVSPQTEKDSLLLVGTPAWISPILFTAKKTMFFLYFSYNQQVAKNKKFQPNLAIFARPSWNFWFHFSHVMAPSLRDQWQSAPPELVQNAWRTKLGPWNFAALMGWEECEFCHVERS